MARATFSQVSAAEAARITGAAPGASVCANASRALSLKKTTGQNDSLPEWIGQTKFDLCLFTTRMVFPTSLESRNSGSEVRKGYYFFPAIMVLGKGHPPKKSRLPQAWLPCWMPHRLQLPMSDFDAPAYGVNNYASPKPPDNFHKNNRALLKNPPKWSNFGLVEGNPSLNKRQLGSSLLGGVPHTRGDPRFPYEVQQLKKEGEEPAGPGFRTLGTLLWLQTKAFVSCKYIKLGSNTYTHPSLMIT